jgi:glycosyltransferase involved in cell wall biosynthesis
MNVAQRPTDVSTDSPLIDVVLPTYGSVPYLRQAIDGVFAQSETRWRLTLVDNSPERGEAARVLHAYRDDPRVRYLATGGLRQPANWTAALRSGDAPFVALLCDDDWWEPGYLERRLAFLTAHPECGFVFSNYREVDEHGREIAVRAPRVAPGVHAPTQFAPREYAGNVVPVATPLYRRSALQVVGEHFADVLLCDYDLWMRLCVQFSVGFLDVRDCAGRMHPGSVTSGLSEYGRFALETVDRLDAVVDATDPALVPAPLRRRRRAGALLTMALDATERGEGKAARRLVRDAVKLHPRAVLDPRVPVSVGLGALGPLGTPVLPYARELQRRHHIRVHREDIEMLLDDLRHHPRATRLRAQT